MGASPLRSACFWPVAAAAATTRPTPPATPPVSGQTGDEVPAGGPPLGFPVFATKNTTRIAGGDAIADAAAVALATYPARTPESRPQAVILAEVRDWRTGIVASVLVGRPIRAPILFADGDTIPDATKAALDALQPTGSKEAGGAQVIRVGTKAPVEGYKTTDVEGRQPGRAGGGGGPAARRPPRAQPSGAVVVASSERPEYAMPAAGWAAKSGDPLLWVGPNGVPAETEAAIKTHKQAKIYVLGPPDAVPDTVLTALEKLGTVKRIAGTDPVTSAIAFARFADGDFGWYGGRPRARARVRLHAPARRTRRRPRRCRPPGPTGRCCCCPTRACCPRRCRTTCSTSSPATTPTRCAASTTTAGSSATRARSRPPSRRG